MTTHAPQQNEKKNDRYVTLRSRNNERIYVRDASVRARLRRADALAEQLASKAAGRRGKAA